MKSTFSLQPTAYSLFLILLAAAAFRCLGPWLQQSTGDSPHYLALAMKLRTSGMAGYNLRGVAVKKRSLNNSRALDFVELSPSSSSDPEGDLLRDLQSRGLGYYDEPLHHIPYGEALLLAGIHGLSGNPPSQGWKLVDFSVQPLDLIRYLPWELASLQWPWLVPSFLFSLGVILLTFYLGRKWFDPQSGLWAAFLMAMFPVDILAAQRIWSDDALVFFCLLSLVVSWRALEKKSALRAGLGGFLAGIAFLFKPSALIFALAVGFAELLRHKIKSREAQISSPNLKLLGAFILGGLISTLHWFICEWKAWGRIFPVRHGLADLAGNPWHITLMHRPWPVCLYTFGLFVLSPLLWVGWKQIRERRTQWLLSGYAFFVFTLLLLKGREYRYALPVVPFLAISASAILSKSKWRGLPFLVVIQIVWSFYLTWRFAWQNWGEIMIPW